MTKSSELLGSTMVLLLGRSAGYSFSFLRNLILARMLTKADYGLAAVFGLAMTLVELSGNMAFGVQIIQSKEGDNRDFQASAHALMFVGGTCSSVLIAVMSVPMARLFEVPHLWWAFALLAVVPVCQGLSHLDIMRLQRELNFVPMIMADVVPQFLITASVWPLVAWLGDYRVILWLMIAKAVSGTAMSFVLARRSYRWGWSPQHVRGMLSFGWPLLLSGLVMFGCQQADQLIVGAAFSLNVLANYALAFSLVSIPWFIFSQVGASLMLPLLSRVQDDSQRLRRHYRIIVEAATIAGVACYVPLMVISEQVVTLLFGAKYRGTGVYVAILGAGFAVRFFRFASAYAAAAKADTINQLNAYLWRGISLPLALGVVAVGGTPVQIAGCALAGEVLAAAYSLRRLWRRQSVPLSESYRAVAYLVTMVSIGMCFPFAGGAHLSIWLSAIAGLGMFSSTLAAAWFMFPEVAGSLIASAQRNSVETTVQPART